MSVILIAHYLGPRLGIGQYLNRLLPPLSHELLDKGIDFLVVASPNAYKNTPAIQQLENHVLIEPALDYSPIARYLWLLLIFPLLCLKKQVKCVVWLSNPMILPFHPKSIAVIHDVNEWKDRQKYGSTWKTTLRSLVYLDLSISLSQKVIAISHSTLQDLMNFRGTRLSLNKIIAIQNGSDSGWVNLPIKSMKPSSRLFLLSVGRIDPDAKKLPEALKLTSALRNVSGLPWELHLIGGMNVTTEASGIRFLASVEQYDWVHYHGYVEDEELAEWYQNAAGVIFLSDNEGFGFPISEAASFGRWAIVSNLNKASVESGAGNLIVVDPTDPESAAVEIHSVLSKSKNPISLNAAKNTWSNVAESYAQEILLLKQ